MKAADIRAELTSRGLNGKGDKATITKRLTSATSFGENEIQNELVSLGFSVFKLMRVWDKNKQPIPVVNVYLDKKNPKNKEIFDLDRLLYCVVTVEPKRRSYNIPQCNNCQRYGHTRNYCKLLPRCMFCAGKHKSADCKKDPIVASVCANCGEAHASNFMLLKSRRFVPKGPLTQAAQSLSQHAEPAPDLSTFPSLPSMIRESSVPSSPLQSSQEHSYAQQTSGATNSSQSSGTSNDRQSSGPSWNNSTNPPNMDFLTSCLMNSIKPIIEMIISNITPLIENCIKNCLNGSK